MRNYQTIGYRAGTQAAEFDYDAGLRHDPTANIEVDDLQIREYAKIRAEHATEDLGGEEMREAQQQFLTGFLRAYYPELQRRTRAED